MPERAAVSIRTLVLGLAALLAPGAAVADEVYLTSGGQLSGRIVKKTATEVQVDLGSGTITVPMSHVVRIENKKSPLDEYDERAGRIAAGDVEGWVALGQWASDKGLGAQAGEAYHRALAAAPDDPRANAGLGNVKMGDRWVTQDESYQAQGYVKFEGQWITPAEHEAILRERAAEAAHDSARRQAEQSAREAEARAQEAEDRARKAEAEAAEAQQGLPLWYGWGAGPVAWPTGPIVVPPNTTRPRPAPVRR